MKFFLHYEKTRMLVFGGILGWALMGALPVQADIISYNGQTEAETPSRMVGSGDDQGPQTPDMRLNDGAPVNDSYTTQTATSDAWYYSGNLKGNAGLEDIANQYTTNAEGNSWMILPERKKRLWRPARTNKYGAVLSTGGIGLLAATFVDSNGMGVFDSGRTSRGDKVVSINPPSPPVTAPVPEPGTLGLMGLGLVSLMGIARRRKK